jgi:hypothetical protein
MFYAFFWIIPQRLNFLCQRFATLCLSHLHRRVGIKNHHNYPPMKMGQGVPKRWHTKFRRRELPRRKHTIFQDSWIQGMGPIDRTETTVRIYHYSLCHSPEERSYLINWWFGYYPVYIRTLKLI